MSRDFCKDCGKTLNISKIEDLGVFSVNCVICGKTFKSISKPSIYDISGEEPTDCDPDGVEAINCIEEYKEFLYKRVNMMWNPNGEHK